MHCKQNHICSSLKSLKSAVASEPQFVEQIVKIDAAMIEFFNEFKGIGKCVFPSGPHAWSKSNCVHAIYDDLGSHEGEIGILYSALALAAVGVSGIGGGGDDMPGGGMPDLALAPGAGGAVGSSIEKVDYSTTGNSFFVCAIQILECAMHTGRSAVAVQFGIV